ncbi:L-fucose permease [Purpureocillium lavendulum]|uniref:L-fucose permease n=1 Tax=Purpureocillium lavendulum TaxID=1247861 RepID=A0AB34FWH5_9HYPO|nr:L-fucose permease [Purpureocillium lavendulum]
MAPSSSPSARVQSPAAAPPSPAPRSSSPSSSSSPQPQPQPQQQPPARSLARRVLAELGLVALARAPRDVKLLVAQRLVRLAAYGASTLVLVSFLRALGHSRAQAGLFMTLTLAGDVVVSLALALAADRLLGRRAVLRLGAALMAASGLVFAAAPPSYAVLLAAAVLGVISPSGNEIGPFRAVEESVVAHLTPPRDRPDVYAWYSLAGTAGTALGMVVCGWAVEGARSALGWSLLAAYRAVFLAYAALGLVKLALALALSPACEADEPPAKPTRKPAAATVAAETTPLLDGVPSPDPDPDSDPEPQPETKPRQRWWAAMVPQLSPESKGITAALCLLFALDSFASGLAPLSWVTYYFRSRFDLDEGRLGSVFFTTSIISASSVIVASSLAKRLGNVKTMVFTHLPSAVFLALIPVPSSLPLALLFLILRACTQSMDVAPRSAFLAAILLPGERTAVMGAVNVVKTTAQSLGPLITGVLAGRDLFWVSFVCAGSLKACYDLGLLAVFKNREHRDAEQRHDEETQ